MTRGRRWLIVTVALVATLGGCAATAGDGKIADDWPVMASASPKVPTPGVCYEAFDTYASRIGAVFTNPIACTVQHVVETFHVGQFPEGVAAVPTAGHPDNLKAFEECEAKAKDYLGGDWYGGRLYLNVTVPLTRQWDGGGRWFRCELIETQSLANETVVKRGSPLSGALRNDAPVAQRCGNMVNVTDDSWQDLTPTDCAQPHDAEFTGVFKVPGVYEPTAEQTKTIYQGCWDVVAKYAGGTRGRIQMGYLAWGTTKTNWTRGDHWVRCYAWAGDKKKMVGTVKGIGNAAPRRS